MAYVLETFKELPQAQQHEMRAAWSGAAEQQLLDDHATYDMHLVAYTNGIVAGWSAIRAATTRLTADITVDTEGNPAAHTTCMIEALRAVGGGKTSIEWWTRGQSRACAQRVAHEYELPLHRVIKRMERTDAPADPKIQIRSFRADDAKELVRVNNSAFTDHPDQFDLTVAKFNHQLEQKHASYRDILLHHIDQKLAAFIWTFPRSTAEGELHVLAVAPEFQGRGLGGQMLDAGVGHLMNGYGIEITSLYVDASNEGAVRLYEKHGFVDVREPLTSYLI